MYDFQFSCLKSIDTKCSICLIFFFFISIIIALTYSNISPTEWKTVILIIKHI